MNMLKSNVLLNNILFLHNILSCKYSEKAFTLKGSTWNKFDNLRSIFIRIQGAETIRRIARATQLSSTRRR